MEYLSEKETSAYIFPILDLFKSGNFQEVLTIIKEKNIDPAYSSEIISDYAALWLDDKYIVDFFKEIKKIGGNPIGHHTIFQNCIQQNKTKQMLLII